MWMLKDKEFYKEVVQILRDRLMYDEKVWSFSLFHKDLVGLAEYFDELSQFKKSHYEMFKILEYYPLSSKRAHKHLKCDKNQITNQDFKQTYERFLIYSFLQNNPDNTTFIIVFTYYLILQDRIEEA